jgi:uncharacterized protein
MALLRLLALLLLLSAGIGAHAQEPLPVPALSARVVDQTGTLTPGERQALESRLAAFEAQAGPQIVVLVVATTVPEDIASYAQRVGEAWKLGRRDVGDGLLLVVAKDDRRLWIATSKALEGAIPDLAARQVIQEKISPAFKRGDYAGGLTAGIDALMARIRGEGLPVPTPGPYAGAGDDGVDLESLLIFFFVGVPIIGSALTGIFGRRLGSLLSSAGAGAFGWAFTSSWVLAAVAATIALVVVGILGIGATRQRLGRLRRGRSDPVIWSGGTGGWGGGSSGGWGGGGGFSSGGGGDFGGGGAGGDW